MRVLHAPAEIAGQASTLAKALRRLGIEAHSIAYNPGFPQYTPDEMHDYDARSALPRYAGYLKTLAAHLGRYDVYHFHFGRTLVPPHNPDLPLYRATGGKVVFHYHGCDIRNRAHMLATHTHAACTECDPFCNPVRQRAIGRAAAAHADAEFVSTPDLLESAPRAEHLPVAIDLSDYDAQPVRKTPRLVLHAPTNRLIKGTRYVEAAFEALRPEFPGVTFRTVERMPWHELRALMAEADVVVDQVFMGWYGMVAIEALALGRPALCYIRPDLEPRLVDDPIVRTTKETLARDLRRVLTEADRHELAARGRAFVARENAAPVIARRLAGTYARLTGAEPPRA